MTTLQDIVKKRLEEKRRLQASQQQSTKAILTGASEIDRSGLSTVNKLPTQSRGQKLYQESVEQQKQRVPGESGVYSSFDELTKARSDKEQYLRQAQQTATKYAGKPTELLNKIGNYSTAKAPLGGWESKEQQLEAELGAMKQNFVNAQNANIYMAQQSGDKMEDLGKQQAESALQTMGERFSDKGVKTKREVNPAWLSLTAEEKQVNRVTGRVQKYIEAPQMEIGDEMTPEQQRLLKKERYAQSYGQTTGVEGAQNYINEQQKHGNEIMKRQELAEAAKTDIEAKEQLKEEVKTLRAQVDIDDDEELVINADGQIEIKTKDGEIIDPVERAEAKVNKEYQEAKDELVKNYDIKKSRIINAGQNANGQLTDQALRELENLADDRGKDFEKLEDLKKTSLSKAYLTEKKRQKDIEASLSQGTQEVNLADLMKRERRQGVLNIYNSGRAKTLEIASQMWDKMNKYDQEGENQELAGKYLDTVLEDGEVTPVEFGELADQYFGKDIEAAYKALVSRKGKLFSDMIYDEYLEKIGGDERTIFETRFKKDTNFINSDIEAGAIDLRKFVNKIEDELGDLADPFITAQLKTFAETAESPSVRTESSLLLRAYEPEINTLTKTELEAKYLSGGFSDPEKEKEFLSRVSKLKTSNSGKTGGGISPTYYSGTDDKNPESLIASDFLKSFNAGTMTQKEILQRFTKEDRKIRDKFMEMVADQGGKRKYGMDDASIANIQDQIMSLKELKSDGNYEYVSGAFRTPTPFSMKSQDIQSLVDNFISSETLRALANAKSEGITFGALSEGEVGLVSAAANRLNSKVIKNKDGKFKRFKASEGQVLDDINFLIEKMEKSIKGKTGATRGESLTADELEYLNSL